MKKNTLGLVAVAGMLLAQSASAITIDRNTGYYSGNGGEFTVSGMGADFQTFCLERNENAAFNNVDPNPQITYYAVGGGYGGYEMAVGGDPISVATAWLYGQFLDGVLTGYDYDPLGGRAASAGELQAAFWWLENEYRSWEPYDQTANVFLGHAYTALNATDWEDLRAAADPAGEYGVAVVNFTLNGVRRQSMLVRVPDGGMTLVLMGLGVMGCMALRRRLF